MKYFYWYIINIINCDKIYNSFEEIQNVFQQDVHCGILLIISSERCAPCRALHSGPLKELEIMVNNKLENKKLLIITLDANNHLKEILNRFNIFNISKSIPHLILIKNNNLVYGTEGYDMYNPKKWLKDISNIIIEKLK